MTRFRTTARCGLFLAAAAGCSVEPKQKPVYKVTGRLTYEGKPMAGAFVGFHSADPTDRKTPAHGTGQADGRYVLHTYRTDDGAPAGEYIVTLIWPGPKPKLNPTGPSLDPEEAGGTGTADRLKDQYALVGVSKLRAKVEPKDNVIDFNLP